MAIQYVKELDPKSEFRLFMYGDIATRGEFDTRYASMLATYRGVRTFDGYTNPAPRGQAVDFSYQYSPYYSYSWR
jgi:hypothetical protein